MELLSSASAEKAGSIEDHVWSSMDQDVPR
jgi:hypothetical protein